MCAGTAWKGKMCSAWGGEKARAVCGGSVAAVRGSALVVRQKGAARVRGSEVKGWERGGEGRCRCQVVRMGSACVCCRCHATLEGRERGNGLGGRRVPKPDRGSRTRQAVLMNRVKMRQEVKAPVSWKRLSEGGGRGSRQRYRRHAQRREGQRAKARSSAQRGAQRGSKRYGAVRGRCAARRVKRCSGWRMVFSMSGETRHHSLAQVWHWDVAQRASVQKAQMYAVTATFVFAGRVRLRAGVESRHVCETQQAVQVQIASSRPSPVPLCRLSPVKRPWYKKLRWRGVLARTNRTE